MIDWKKEYDKVKLMLILTMITTCISSILFFINLDEKDEIIWQQSMEIEDLKEQIYIKERRSNKDE